MIENRPAAGSVMDELRAQPMRSMQLIVMGLCVTLNLLDGLDVLAMAFTAPAVAEAWALRADQVGLLLSAGLAGMGLGALVLSPVADMIGRKPTILLSLCLVSGGMFGAAASEGIWQLLASRFVTGIGVGGMISSVSATLIEYASVKARGFVVGLMAVSFPAGAVIGGALSIILVRDHGWQAVFVAGGVLTAAAIPVVWLLIPESIDFLIARRPPSALARINRVLARLRLAALAALPPLPGVLPPSLELRQFFRPPLARQLVHVGVIMLLTMLSFYFILNWAPKLLIDGGLSANTGISVGMLMNVGGMLGGVVVGVLLRYCALRWVLPTVLTCMAVGIACYGALSQYAVLVAGVAFILGFLMFGAQVVIYTLMLTSFPASVRATCIGISSTVGRVGSVLGPYLGGLMLARGSTVPVICVILAVPALLAALLATKGARFTPQ